MIPYGSSIEDERHLSLDLISSKLTLCNVISFVAVFEAIKQRLDLKFNNAFSRILHHLGGLYSNLFKVSAIEVQIWGIIHTCYS